MGKVLVIGSINMDLVVKTNRIPKEGETILGGDFSSFCGGKGMNQAVAASKFCSDMEFIGKVGDDIFGRQAIDNLIANNIKASTIGKDSQYPTGVALITVDQKGQNNIVVASGANQQLTVNDMRKYETSIINADYVLMQLEIPVLTVEYVVQLASAHGKKVILNPAPAKSLPPELLSQLYAITPNESEASLLTGIPVHNQYDAMQAAFSLHDQGVKNVIITLGAEGLVYYDGHEFFKINGHSVNVLDTTAAGDTFNGVLVAELASGKNMLDALKVANAAAALSVTKLGAQTSAPNRNEIQQLLQ